MTAFDLILHVPVISFQLWPSRVLASFSLVILVLESKHKFTLSTRQSVECTFTKFKHMALQSGECTFTKFKHMAYSLGNVHSLIRAFSDLFGKFLVLVTLGKKMCDFGKK